MGVFNHISFGDVVKEPVFFCNPRKLSGTVQCRIVANVSETSLRILHKTNMTYFKGKISVNQ